jgi:hypothetical protein
MLIITKFDGKELIEAKEQLPEQVGKAEQHWE